MRAMRVSAALLLALSLAACGDKPVESAKAPEPAAPAVATAPVSTGTTTPAAADPSPAASPAAAEPAPAAPAATEPAATPAAPAKAAAAPTGPAPREGTDYVKIDPPQPLGTSPGKVEIAEVFSYTCIHCAHLDKLIPAWKATLPAGTEFVYVPTAYGGVEQVARGFYAAQALGELDKTHSAMFKALAEDRRGGNGSADDIAALYADLGIDRDTMLATMKSFGVNASIARNNKAVPRWSIEGTPTMVVAGKYRVVVTADRGQQGMLDSARWLAERELSGTNPAP